MSHSSGILPSEVCRLVHPSCLLLAAQESKRSSLLYRRRSPVPPQGWRLPPILNDATCVYWCQRTLTAGSCEVVAPQSPALFQVNPP